MVRDIVNFLDYIGEPIKREREALGIRVIGFLLVFLLIAYHLKREIWKGRPLVLQFDGPAKPRSISV